MDRTNLASPVTAALLGIEERNGEIGKESFLAFAAEMLLRTKAVYYQDIDTVYLPTLVSVDDAELALHVVHELGHAIAQRLVPIDTVPLEDRCVWTYVDEGLAEHISLQLFKGHYESLRTPSLCCQRGLSHLNVADFLANVDGLSKNLSSQYIEPEADSETYEVHCVGYRFFTTACRDGCCPADILNNPPESFSEVLHPELYIERVMG